MPHKIACTNEILGALSLNDMNSANIAELRKDPHSYLMSRSNKELPESISVNFVDNSSGVVNLALPYYSGLDEAFAQAISAEDMDDVSGGEIFILALVFGVGAGVALTATVGTLLAKGIREDEGYYLDGSPIPGAEEDRAKSKK